MLKVSIITITYNRAETLTMALQSVADQTYKNIEHIVVDGKSSDNTMEIISQFPHIAKVVSERDEGLYDALNKGIQMATGDIVGVLHSDDFFTDTDVISKVVQNFDVDKVDMIHGDVQYVKPNDIKRVVRYYSGAKWNISRFRRGFMPAHPSVYIKREYYNKLGLYKTDYRIAADFELMVRYLYGARLRHKYCSFPIVTMRTGGISTRSLKSRWVANQEIIRACRENGISTNVRLLSLKIIPKLLELR